MLVERKRIGILAVIWKRKLEVTSGNISLQVVVQEFTSPALGVLALYVGYKQMKEGPDSHTPSVVFIECKTAQTAYEVTDE